jgi:acetoin utilization protein AcuB
MLVKNWMSRDVITIDINDSMQDATRLVKQQGISRLPVMKKDKLVGIITDRDLKRASAYLIRAMSSEISW